MHTLTTDRLSLTLGDDPLVVRSLVHRPSGRTVVADGEMDILLRLPERVSDPVFLRAVSGAEQGDGFVRFALADATGAHRARCRIEAGGEGLGFHLSVDAASPVWMAEWKVFGFGLDEVIVPALGGQALTKDMPAGHEVAYKYPFWWNAQFALGSLGEGAGGVWLRTKEEAPGLRLMRVRKEAEGGGFALGLGFEAEAPLEGTGLEAIWYLDGYAGGWERPVEVHRAWLEEAFALRPYRAHPHFPAWAEEVDVVLEIWGMRKDRGRPAHTFAEMIERIEAFARLHAPERTLLYLPGYAEGGIDSNAPSYAPSPMLGGRDGFHRLIDRAHALGYRVMIHTNVLAMAFTHPRWPDFAGRQVVDPFGRPQTWGLDLDGDWLAEPYFAYINPGHAAWGDLMEDELGGLIRDFGLDAVFLDQTLLAFNDAQGPNFVAGMRRHIERLQQAFPDVLFAGEGMHEQVLSALPLAQIHGLDSLSGIHGLEGRKPWRYAHPVSTHLFGRYTRFVAHLLTRHPESPDFADQDAAYAALGIVPAVVLYRNTQPVDSPVVRALLARVSKIEDRGSRIEDRSAIERA